MVHRLFGGAFLTTAALTLGACGGGGGGVNSTPSPPVTVPTAAPPATPFGDPPKGVTTTTSLATLGGFQTVRWNADLKAYEVQIDGASGRLVTGDATGRFGTVTTTNGSYRVSTFADAVAFDYTRYGNVVRSPNGPSQAFAFGLATPAGAVPTTGSATYDAQITGHAGGWDLYGTAQFQFNFRAGTLAGFMDPHTNGPMESPALPRYTFTQTVFSPGSTTFSGSFDFVGPTPSSFSGQFTGPGAEELMASFTAPFRDWDAQENPTVWGVMEGVMVGRRR